MITASMKEHGRRKYTGRDTVLADVTQEVKVTSAGCQEYALLNHNNQVRSETTRKPFSLRHLRELTSSGPLCSLF